MARIRNAVRAYLTRDTSHVGPLRQWRWWTGQYRRGARAGNLQAWLLWEGGRPVGYGLVTWSRARWWVSGGLEEAARGRGLGRLLFEFLTREAMARDRGRRGQGTAWLEVRPGNTRAILLYLSLGYRVVGADWREAAGPVALMRAQEASPGAAKPAGTAGGGDG